MKMRIHAHPPRRKNRKNRTEKTCKSHEIFVYIVWTFAVKFAVKPEITTRVEIDIYTG